MWIRLTCSWVVAIGRVSPMLRKSLWLLRTATCRAKSSMLHVVPAEHGGLQGAWCSWQLNDAIKSHGNVVPHQEWSGGALHWVANVAF